MITIKFGLATGTAAISTFAEVKSADVRRMVGAPENVSGRVIRRQQVVASSPGGDFALKDGDVVILEATASTKA